MPTSKRARAVAQAPESTASSNAPASIPPAAAADATHAGGETPYDAYFAALEKCVEDHGALGYTVIRGLEASDEEEDSDKCDKYTADQMDNMRVILITKSRENLIKKANKFASGGQAGSGFCMFNTHSGNVIIAGIPQEISKVSKMKTAAVRFDGLFALTDALGDWDYWFVDQGPNSLPQVSKISHMSRMHDNEEWDEGGGLDQAIKLLAKTWKTLLSKHTNAELGIDSQFTRPAVEVLLGDFAKKVKGCKCHVAFQWKP